MRDWLASKTRKIGGHVAFDAIGQRIRNWLEIQRNGLRLRAAFKAEAEGAVKLKRQKRRQTRVANASTEGRQKNVGRGAEKEGRKEGRRAVERVLKGAEREQQ